MRRQGFWRRGRVYRSKTQLALEMLQATLATSSLCLTSPKTTLNNSQRQLHLALMALSIPPQVRTRASRKVLSPLLHHFPASFQQVRPRVCSFNLIADGVR